MNDYHVDWSYKLGETGAQLQNEITAFATSGGGPELVTLTASPASYLSIWRHQAVNEWSADHGLTTVAFEAKAALMQAQGPLSIAPTGRRSRPRSTLRGNMGLLTA